MSESMIPHSSDDRHPRFGHSAGRTGFIGFESEASLREAMALEGLLRQIGQDCCKESRQYLEKTQAREHGE